MKFSLFSEETLNQFLQRYLEAGKWDKAADMYKKLLDMHPENANYRLRLAEMYMKCGNRKEALDQYQQVAEDFARMNNLDKAITIYRTILNLDASLSHIRIQLADVYAMQGKMDEVWTQYIAAFKYLEEKKLASQAVSVLENMSKLKFEDVKPMIQLAEMFLSRNLRPQAINQFLAISEFLMEKQQYAEAVKYYKQVLELDPRNREASFGIDIIKRTTPDAMVEPKPQEPAKSAAEIKSELEVTESPVAPGFIPGQTSGGQAPVLQEVGPDKPEPEPVKPVVMAEPAPQEEKKEPPHFIRPVPVIPAPQMAVDLEAAVQEDLDLELLFYEDKLETLLEDIITNGCRDESAAEEHYNLGLKYQTMSLWDAAIEEFIQAAGHKELQQKCFRSVGECYQQKGMPRHAQKYQHMALVGEG